MPHQTTKEAKRRGTETRGPRKKLRNRKECLVPECRKEASRRGLCPGCYSAAWRAIKDGKATEDSLISSGLLLHPYDEKRGAFANAIK